MKGQNEVKSSRNRVTIRMQMALRPQGQRVMAPRKLALPAQAWLEAVRESVVAQALVEQEKLLP